MNERNDAVGARVLVACLCASWCGTCRDYAPTFEQQASACDADFAWIDIEEHEEVLDGLEVENFPTLLIARGNDVLFFGPVTPQPGTLARMVQAACDGALQPVPEPVPNLPGRVRQIRDSACARSARRSSTSSTPTDSRTSASPMPSVARASRPEWSRGS